MYLQIHTANTGMNEFYWYNYITRYLRMQLNHTQGYHAIITTWLRKYTDLISLQILSDRLQYCQQNDLTDPHVSVHLPYIPGNTTSNSTAHGPKESPRWCIRTVLRDTDICILLFRYRIHPGSPISPTSCSIRWVSARLWLSWAVCVCEEWLLIDWECGRREQRESKQTN